jgi:LysR family nitrogen assimilation transcriptional regulator
MDLRQLRYFVTIADVGSFSKAAHRLHVAQPALSQHVRNMEIDLGVELLHRSPRGVRPTEAGETLLRHARLILGQMESAREAVHGSRREPAGEVRFGMPGTISQMLCLPLIVEARRRYPKVKLRVAEAMSGFVLDWLREGKIDLGVLYRSVNDKGLIAQCILAEELCLIGPPGPAAADAPPPGPVPFAAIGRLPLILPSAGHGLRDLVDERAAAEGVRIATVIDIDTYGQIKRLVERGLGYAILPVAAVKAEVDAGRLASWPAGVPVLTRDLHIVRPRNAPTTNAVRAVEALARATLVKLVRDGVWAARLAVDDAPEEGDGLADQAPERSG